MEFKKYPNVVEDVNSLGLVIKAIVEMLQKKKNELQTWLLINI